MPHVRLTGSYDRTTLGAVGEAVHRAMVAHLDVPATDVFRSLDSTAEGATIADSGYLGVARERPLFIEIALRRGRTDDAKRAFYRTLADDVRANALARAEDLLIVLRENEAVDWSFGNGEAQNAPGSRVAAANIAER